MLEWIKQFFAPHAVITSRPYRRGREWVYFFGNEQGFEFRAFKTEEEATSSRKLLLSTINIAPEISVRHYVISAASAQSVDGIDSYHDLLQSLCRSRKDASQSEVT